MSTEDKEYIIQQLADIVSKPNQKTENKKILWMLICTIIVCIPIGIDLGRWETFKEDTVEFKKAAKTQLDSHEKSINELQEDRNRKTADRISKIQIK